MSTPLPGDFVDVDFQIEKEDWNTYELNDYVKIKGRLIVLRVSRDKKSGQYSAQTQNIFVTFAPSHLKGPPSTPPAIDNIDKSKMIPVEIVHSNEIWNIYKITTTGERIKVKLIVTDVFKIKDTYDQFGQPFYLIKSGVYVTPAPSDIKP